MEINDFSHSSFDDIVFEGRNKGYGAYHLRQLEARDILLALIFGSIVLSAIVFGPIVWKNIFGKDKKRDTTVVAGPPPIVLAPKPKSEEEKKPEVVREIKKAELVKSVQYTPVPDNQVTEEPKSVDSLLNRNASTINQEGDPNEPPLDPPGGGGGGGQYEPEEVFLYVDEEPQFKEGDFILFIEKNYQFTDRMYEKGKAGTIIVSFTVEKDGSVTDISVLKAKGLTPEQDAEAVRVIRLSSGKWTPGKLNGTAVRTYFKQSFVFDASTFE